MANINIGGRLHSTATGNTVAGANEILDDNKGKKQSVINQEVDAALAGKQATIDDLSAIRSGAAAGATAYQKPASGVPASDLASGVIPDVSGFYTKPASGIPASDIASGVIPTVPTISTDISADAASDVKTSSPKSVKTYVDAGIAAVESDLADLADEVEAIDIGAYVTAWDGNSEPVVANIPAGVSVNYNSTTYTGTLAASASTIQKIYLVATGTTDNYDRYITVGDSMYSWVNIGTTEITLADYATKAEVSQLQQEVTADISQLEAKVVGMEGGAITPSLQLEQGAIGSTTGEDSSSTTRLRTTNYIKADGISLTLSANKCYVSGYKNDGTFVDSQGWIETSQEVRIAGATKYRIVFAYTNNATIVVSDFGSLGISVSAVFNGTLATKTQLSEVKATADGNEFALFNEGKLSTKYVENSYVDNTDGSFDTYNGWSRTEYINVRPFTKVTITATHTTAYCAKYGKNKNFIARFSLHPGTNEIVVGENDYYIAISDSTTYVKQAVFEVVDYKADSALSSLAVQGADIANIKNTLAKYKDYVLKNATSLGTVADIMTEYSPGETGARVLLSLPILLTSGVSIEMNSAYQVCYELFDSANQSLFSSDWLSGIVFSADYLFNYQTVTRVRFMFRKADNGATTKADVIANGVSSMSVDYVLSEWNDNPDLTLQNAILERIYSLIPENGGILGLNPEKEIVPRIENLCRRFIPYGGSPTDNPPVLSFVWMSDVHADNKNILRVKEFYDKYSDYINGGVIDTGDFIGNTFSQGLPTATSEVPGFIRIVGNHDAYNKNGSTWVLVPAVDVYQGFLKGYIENWGVIQPANAEANGYCYFYKDFSENNVRIIALDGEHWDTTQKDWLIATLSDSGTKHIVCLLHRAPFMLTPQPYNPFDNNDYVNETVTEGTAHVRDHEPYVEAYTAVKNFIDNGGNFVCWLCGHLHDDYIGLGRDADVSNQLVIGVACASSSASATNYGSMSRVVGEKSQDCFNVVGIDTASRTIKIMRVGADFDRYLRKKDTMSWDYKKYNEFDVNTIYQINSKVAKDGKLYRFTKRHLAGVAWDDSIVVEFRRLTIG